MIGPALSSCADDAALRGLIQDQRAPAKAQSSRSDTDAITRSVRIETRGCSRGLGIDIDNAGSWPWVCQARANG